jgi:hypothetical protein
MISIRADRALLLSLLVSSSFRWDSSLATIVRLPRPETPNTYAPVISTVSCSHACAGRHERLLPPSYCRKQRIVFENQHYRVRVVRVEVRCYQFFSIAPRDKVHPTSPCVISYQARGLRLYQHSWWHPMCCGIDSVAHGGCTYHGIEALYLAGKSAHPPLELVGKGPSYLSKRSSLMHRMYVVMFSRVDISPFFMIDYCCLETLCTKRLIFDIGGRYLMTSMWSKTC